MKKTFEELLADAEKDDVNAQAAVGYSYYVGSYSKPGDVETDHDKAAYWYERGAWNGSLYCQQHLALCYLSGEGRELDPDEGEFWLLTAAHRGDYNSMDTLVEIYRGDRGFKENPESMVFWLEKQIESGVIDPRPMLELCRCYAEGIGVEKNTGTAELWKKRAEELVEKYPKR